MLFWIAFVVEEFKRLVSKHPQDDAEVFLGMIQGKLHERVLLGVDLGHLDKMLEQQVDHALIILMPYLGTLKPGA